MYADLSPENPYDSYWTVALVSNGRATNFGVFATIGEAIEAMDSGLVTVHEDETLRVTAIRQFPTK